MKDGRASVSSRRRVLAGGAGAVAGLLAGCIADSNGSDADGSNANDSEDANGTGESDTATGDGSPPSWARWSPAPGDADTSMARVSYIDHQSVRESFHASAEGPGTPSDLEATLGLERGAFDDQTIVSFASGAETSVVQGDIEASTVRDAGPARTGTYGEYDVLGGDLAVRDGVVIVGPLYERVIDARAGDVDTLLDDAGGQWQSALGRVGTAVIAGIKRAPEQPWSISAVSMEPTDDGTVELATTMYFETAAAASEHRNRAREAVPLGRSEAEEENWNVQSTTVEERQVVVEATATDFRV